MMIVPFLCPVNDARTHAYDNKLGFYERKSTQRLVLNISSTLYVVDNTAY